MVLYHEQQTITVLNECLEMKLRFSPVSVQSANVTGVVSYATSIRHCMRPQALEDTARDVETLQMEHIVRDVNLITIEVTAGISAGLVTVTLQV